eukprot:TCONS_00057481-protein
MVMSFTDQRKDVQSILATAEKKYIETNDCDKLELQNLTLKKNKCTAWVHVISPGECQRKDFIKVGNKKLWTPIGYEGLRKVFVDGKWINLFCKIKRNDVNPDEIPLKFMCYTEEEPVISVSTTSISTTVHETLLKLGLQKKTRRWSGVDFFGLSRSDVSRYIESNMNEGAKANKKHCDLPEILTSVVNTAHRNAGPTSNLCEKSQKQRNELIHELVKLVSAGDVRAYIEHL